MELQQLIVVLFLALLYSPDKVHGGVSISLRGSVAITLNEFGYYVVKDGSIISVTCSISSSMFTPPTLKKEGLQPANSQVVLVSNGLPNILSSRYKFNLPSLGGIDYGVEISGISSIDTGRYICCTEYYFWSSVQKYCTSAYLQVEEEPDPMCAINGTSNGIVNEGSVIKIKCLLLEEQSEDFRVTIIESHPPIPSRPNRATELSVEDESDFEIEGVKYREVLFVHHLQREDNNKIFGCFLGSDDEPNFCSHFPVVMVIEDLTAQLLPPSQIINEGGNTFFTCISSVPTQEDGYFWTLVDVPRDTRLAEMGTTFSNGASILFLRSVNSSNSQYLKIDVQCRVSLAGMETFAEATLTIVPEVTSTPVTTVRFTPTKMFDQSGNKDQYSNEPGTVVAVIISIVFVSLLIVFALVFWRMGIHKPKQGLTKEEAQNEAVINPGFLDNDEAANSRIKNTQSPSVLNHEYTYIDVTDPNANEDAEIIYNTAYEPFNGGESVG